MGKKKGPYKRCDKDFIRETLDLINTSKRPVASIAKDLGVSSSTLYGWQKRDRREGEDGETSGGIEESLKIRRLRKELAEARLERDILKKAVAIFSKQPR
ncbi:hypothetical protein A3J90_00450 [candidate division WOR-1 bacterium RIFOXYC2_FULL_37_10]|uniref:Transposase n=1 Tax=candidate division WOR-1 bacterium RIFOXYB2_FULL_37_13 TaxID=1802579 RepID=A0A1F4SMW7_UNCSA|nr:MAG: hypothetical protein A2310_00335 [candidate division WOR-1 bacterium RIFOXYB2_FULL_37_13]OGC32600.1 MAG: hypothetical protein A3J90_00450 [candidate division WOR-1 bacterium RIFOXYC2_FULL_37_10]